MQNDYQSKSEIEFEKEFIDYLTNIGNSKQWTYIKEVKTTEQLWMNFKNILEQNNQARLDRPLSVTEFNQVKRVISNLETPYKAGQFLYGVNGVSEIEVDLDDGRHVFLTVFDQAFVGAGNTVYQVVNQIERLKVIDGKPNRRFDVTLLINGLPIIQIELKSDKNTVNEALNQMHQYISEKQYGDIYSTLQILIGMTPYDAKYMANTEYRKFNKDFAFNWKDEDGDRVIRSWKEFSNNVLSIPAAHELSTRYMILDGRKNKENIMVMRPYQVHATKRVYNKVAQLDFRCGERKLGYVWHTTGSGKTITSFKTAWLASKLPNVDKVIFLVDRIALTNQTAEAYMAYDPVSSFEGKTGVIADTANVADLAAKLTKKSDKNIIVTSIQKMARYVTRDDYKKIEDNILFIFDEAHRSTGGINDNDSMLSTIRNAIPKSAWVGYTGTPDFERTKHIFGSEIHAYTIKNAIADKNVLGFNVSFNNSEVVHDNPTEEQFNGDVPVEVYDEHPDHLEYVVRDIYDNWKQRSNNGKYNALLTVKVGGGRTSVPRVIEYYNKFKEINGLLTKEEKLKIAVSFSVDTSNGDMQLATNQSLTSALKEYNDMFDTDFGIDNIKGYTEDLYRRLNKTADDGNFLDLVIVIDQLLTGFDAPGLNTLYVDRVLRGSSLIQAYSRTNRISNMIEKPYGNIINYRYPEKNREEMNLALARYTNRDKTFEQLSLDDIIEGNENSGVIAKKYSEVQTELREVVRKLNSLTNGLTELSPSDQKKEDTLENLKKYNSLVSMLKQYTTDDEGNPVSAYENPEQFYESIGITKGQELTLTNVIAEELKKVVAKREKIDVSQINLTMVHICDVKVDYDYIVELIAEYANQIKNNDMEQATITGEAIKVEVTKIESLKEREKFDKFVEAIKNKDYEFEKYPIEDIITVVNKAIETYNEDLKIKVIAEFISKWGLDNVVNPFELETLFKKHNIGFEDLDKQNELNNIMNGAKDYYKQLADSEVSQMSWIKFRIEFRIAIYELADKIAKGW